jgi:uncharacterized integral membrane protein
MNPKLYYYSGVHLSAMRRTWLLVAAVLLIALLVPVAAAENTLTVSAVPHIIEPGGVITLNGTVTGVTTIAVYLFISGPGLDARGVTLENLNIAAGRGLFTTAPVNMSDGSWKYKWDTSVIIGNLEPGNYTLYVVSSPVDRLRFQKEDFATAEITVLPSSRPASETPLDPMVTFVAIGVVVIACRVSVWEKE